MLCDGPLALLKFFLGIKPCAWTIQLSCSHVLAAIGRNDICNRPGLGPSKALSHIREATLIFCQVLDLCKNYVHLTLKLYEQFGGVSKWFTQEIVFLRLEVGWLLSFVGTRLQAVSMKRMTLRFLQSSPPNLLVSTVEETLTQTPCTSTPHSWQVALDSVWWNFVIAPVKSNWFHSSFKLCRWTKYVDPRLLSASLPIAGHLHKPTLFEWTGIHKERGLRKKFSKARSTLKRDVKTSVRGVLRLAQANPDGM